jgi:hypothetical protein
MDSEVNQSGEPQRAGFFRPLKPTEKVVVFVALMFLFWLMVGFEYHLRRPAFGFVIGAAITLWWRSEPAEALQPARFRCFHILFGCLMMLWAIAQSLFEREALPKPSPQPRAIEHTIQYRDSSALPLWRLKVER